MNLHAKILSGLNAHHKAEALFKALARALRDAVELDPRATGQVPSTKGTIQG
jgi:imidazoleglycerol-phosphate dehydratase